MNKLLISNWTTLPVGAVVYLLTTVLLWKTPTVQRRHQAAETASAPVPSWAFSNPEADQLIASLKEEKKAQDKRGQELNELAARLDAERGELNLVTQSVQKMQADFDKNVLRVQEEERANLGKLAKVYSDMTPDGAAAIFADLDDTSVAKILVFMKEAETGALLEAMAKKGPAEAKRAANLSERLRLSISRNTTAK